jgi:hypothetical protein
VGMGHWGASSAVPPGFVSFQPPQGPPETNYRRQPGGSGEMEDNGPDSFRHNPPRHPRQRIISANRAPDAARAAESRQGTTCSHRACRSDHAKGPCRRGSARGCSLHLRGPAHVVARALSAPSGATQPWPCSPLALGWQGGDRPPSGWRSNVSCHNVRSACLIGGARPSGEALEPLALAPGACGRLAPPRGAR